MGLSHIAEKSKKGFYYAIYKGSTAFPYSSDLMHIVLLGSIPFLKAKATLLLADRLVDGVSDYSNLAGYLAAGIAEYIWLKKIEPASQYAYTPKSRNLRGIVETTSGAGLAHLLTS